MTAGDVINKFSIHFTLCFEHLYLFNLFRQIKNELVVRTTFQSMVEKY